MQTLCTIKVGDTFAFYANLTDESGDPITGAGSKLKSQVRTSIDALAAELTITEQPTPGRYLVAAASTATWPVGTQVFCDLRYTDNNVVTSSETFAIEIEKDVTR